MAKKLKRRDFLGLMGVGGVAATTMSCSDKTYEEAWKPWVEPVDGAIPYEPRYYATTTRESAGLGLRVKVVDGRAIMLEGNPEHPINRGSLPSQQQSTIQALYGTERLRRPYLNGQEITWNVLEKTITEAIDKHRGGNISALTGLTTGAVYELWAQTVGAVGSGRVVHYEAFSPANQLAAAEQVFGISAVPETSLEGADLVLSLGARFLETWGEVAANARHYGELKTVHNGTRGKHIQLEARHTMTGTNADSHYQLKPGSETMLALGLISELGGSNYSQVTIDQAASASGLKADSLRALARELRAAKAPVVLPAESLSLGPDAVQHHAAVMLLNQLLGAVGKQIRFDRSQPIAAVPSHQSTVELVEAMNAGQVKVLFLYGTNPAYSLPSELGFADALKKVDLVVAFSDHQNETTALADLVVPVTHDLESWGEHSQQQGIHMLMQPVMKARWQMRQMEDYLIDIIKHTDESAFTAADFREYLQNRWVETYGGEALDKRKFWHECLKRGGYFASTQESTTPELNATLGADFFASVQAPANNDLTLIIARSGRFGDGRYANRGWLQELPDAMTGVVWDSFLEISYPRAEKLGLRFGDVVTLTVNGKSLELPVALSETITDDVVSLETGQGHTHFDKVYNRGVNAFTLFSGALNGGHTFSVGPLSASIAKAGRRVKLATFHLPGKGDKLNTPQTKIFEDQPLWDHDPKHDRHIYNFTTLAALNSGGDGHDSHGGSHGPGGHGGGGAGGHGPVNMDSRFPMHTETNFYPNRDDDPVVAGRDETFYDPYKWEMVVDLNKCTGCGSCVTACYAENNLPVVGKDQVAKGREMAWIRVNRYLGYTEKEGKMQATAHFLPMMCQQCGNAPCESVCPSLATYHNKEGLNAMVYNRCVGTRYCANNCSYKVRRFNWFTWDWPGDLNWQLNPAVTVRQMGVMEKCTFCVQRIRDAKDVARDEDREVRDGEVQVACQSACSSKAIDFGNYKDENSRVYQLANSKLAYRALDDHIKTKPAVTYLKRVRLEDHHA